MNVIVWISGWMGESVYRNRYDNDYLFSDNTQRVVKLSHISDFVLAEICVKVKQCRREFWRPDKRRRRRRREGVIKWRH